MTTDDVVVDISQDGVLACDVQQRFMHGPGRDTGSVDRARCRQVRALDGDCYMGTLHGCVLCDVVYVSFWVYAAEEASSASTFASRSLATSNASALAYGFIKLTMRS